MNDPQRPGTVPTTEPLPRDSLNGDAAETSALVKPPFVKPKLTFVPPKLVRHGSLTELTGFFGPFSP